ncbi:hypothetical protein BGZ63DRAFT_371220 [Mariannaea sp. PMI_226]|nr:hypothetical protein BGZ63DRAFT_371220 [Mariannaea sp. PMI_226]
MYSQQWTTSFDMSSQSTQPESSMATPAPVPSEYMGSPYGNDGRRTPGPPVPYMGAFGVSNGPEPHDMNQSYYPMPPPMDHHQQSQPLMVPPLSLLNNDSASHFRARHLTPEDHSVPGMSDHSINGSPGRRSASTAGGRINKKRTNKSRGTQKAPVLNSPHEEHKNCLGQEVAPQLKLSCPDEERCIFDSRWKHRNQKGHDMWESIQTDFETKFQKRPGKEMLQMKFKRGRSKYFEWLPEDEKLMVEAWKQVEKNRYQLILDTFHELGGSRNMRLNASDVECKVVNDLKLEEGLYIESQGDLNLRRRRKSNAPKRRTNGRGVDEPLSDEMMSVGSHTNEDEVINQVHGRLDYNLEETSSSGNDRMDMQMWGDQPIKMEPGVVMPPHTEAAPQMIRLSPVAASYGRQR